MQTENRPVPGVYQRILRGVHKRIDFPFEYHNAVAIAEPLANMMLECVTREYDIVVPVPASSQRSRQRGYNQAILLGKCMSRKRDVLYVETLGRFGHSRQVGASRKERLTQLKGNIYVRTPSFVRGQRILLVDDVVTTDTTLHECGKVLKESGARSVAAAVVAKH